MITQTQTTSFKRELYEGVHNLTSDVLMLALYTAEADLGPDTAEYVVQGEVVGDGYVAGGLMVSGVVVGASDGVAYVSFSSVSWPVATFTCRGALLYNASKGDRAIAVLNFGADKVVDGQTFTVTVPAATASTALIRMT